MTLPIADPFGFHEPVKVPGGVLGLGVAYRTYEPWTTSHSQQFRPKPAETPLLTMNRQYWVNPPDSPVGYPVAEATCSVNFYAGSGNPEPDLPLMRNFLKEVEENAR